MESRAIRSDMKKKAEFLAKNSRDIPRLKDQRLGKTGYYYILSNTGRIIYHPQEALIGLSFFETPLVKKITSRKEGCIRQFLEGMDKTVIFVPIDDMNYLCFSINTQELLDKNGQDCENLD